MDTYQFFYKNGKEVSSTRTGTMEYHDAPEHDHWHFLDFAGYELVKPDGALVTTGGTPGARTVTVPPYEGVDTEVEFDGEE